MVIYRYNYKDRHDRWYNEIKTCEDFKNIKFPPENELTIEFLQKLGITRNEYLSGDASPEEQLFFEQKRKIKELKDIRKILEEQVISTDKGIFDFDQDSIIRIQLVISTMNDTSIREWTTADNEVVNLNKTDFLNILKLGIDRSDKYYQIFKILRTNILDCETIEDVQQINWNIVNTEIL